MYHLKWPISNKKSWGMQRNKQVWPIYQEKKKKKQAKETAGENDQMLDLIEKYFKIAILNMFTEPKETVTKEVEGASLVAQWLRICLQMQGTRVRALVWEDPTCRGATRSVSHNYWACASGACAPQQERPR